jgi:hypothetical protein
MISFCILVINTVPNTVELAQIVDSSKLVDGDWVLKRLVVNSHTHAINPKPVIIRHIQLVICENAEGNGIKF